jgi:hypothetical protein
MSLRTTLVGGTSKCSSMSRLLSSMSADSAVLRLVAPIQTCYCQRSHTNTHDLGPWVRGFAVYSNQTVIGTSYFTLSFKNS